MSSLPASQPFSCGYNSSYSMLDFQPIFNTGMGGNTSNYTGHDIPICNIDPSQSTFDFAISVTGEFCDLPEDDVFFAAAYTGAADGLVTSVTATTTLPPTISASFVVVYTGLPYSAVSDGGEVRLTAFNNVYGPSTSFSMSLGCTSGGFYASDIPLATTTTTNFYTNVFSMIQTYVPTLLYTDATETLSFSTIPTTVTTSTLTATGFSVAPAVTSTITTSSGTATLKAPPQITTTTRTITRQDITKTSHAIAHTTTHITCIPASTNASPQHNFRRQAKNYRLRSFLHRRLANAHSNSFSNGTFSNSTTISNTTTPPSAATYITGNCAPLSYTTLTTNTVFTSTTVAGNSTVTSTAYTTTTSVSTYTPTNTLYADGVETVTVTPTLTRVAISIVRRKTVLLTTIVTRTKSVYPRHPPKCAVATVD